MRYTHTLAALTVALVLSLGGLGCGLKIARITPLPAEVAMVDANITTVLANSAELIVKADRFVLPITSMEAESVKRGDISASVDATFDAIVGVYLKAADFAIAQMKAGAKTWPQLKALVQPVLDAGQRVIDFTNSIGAIKTRAQSWLVAFRDALANLAGEFLMGGGLR